jgi:hypothetical protein
MLDERYREDGLRWLGGAVENPLWNAHYGAAQIAAWYLACLLEPDPATRTALDAQVDHLRKQHGDGFAPPPPGPACDDPAVDLMDAAEDHIDGLHLIGHNVIYLAYALRVLHDRRDLHRTDIRDTLVGLMRACVKTSRGYGWPGYSEAEAAAIELTIAERDAIDEQGVRAQLIEALREWCAFEPIYAGETHQDQVGHLLTHIHAILLLDEMGHADLARRALAPLALKRKILRRGWFWEPPQALPAKVPSPHLPTEAAFWHQPLPTSDWDFGHHFKYSWSWYALRDLFAEGGMAHRAELQFRRLIAL